LEQNIECQELIISKNREIKIKDSIILISNDMIVKDSLKLQALSRLQQDKNEDNLILTQQLKQANKKVFNRTLLGCFSGLLAILGTGYFAIK
jgi:hypothetical protein